MIPKIAAQADPGFVLAKATARASELLGLSGAALSRVIGVSEPTVSRILRGVKPIDPNKKEGQLALLLVRVYRSLDALVGTDDQKRIIWMNSQNKALAGVPIVLIERPDGLVATLNYLDGMRAPA
ncbi:MAG: antitoxin Xre-like helix-turn-helix domain-containing protein [Pseudomonadota bacterium]